MFLISNLVNVVLIALFKHIDIIKRARLNKVGKTSGSNDKKKEHVQKLASNIRKLE